MSNELQKQKLTAQRYIEGLTFVHTAGADDIERARLRMALAFSPAAAGALSKCTDASIGHAIALSALSGLMPGGVAPDVYLIPRRRNIAPRDATPEYITEAIWQISSRGYTRMAHEAGYTLGASVVYHCDEFAINQGTCPGLTHRPDIDAKYLDTDDEPGRCWKSVRCGYVVARKPGIDTAF